MTVAAILLAAGESERMGTPKPLLDWHGQTLIEYQLDQLRQTVERTVVVLGHRAADIRAGVRRADVDLVVSEEYQRGRASSVRAGAAALPDDTGTIVIVNVDQPRPAKVIRHLLDEHHSSGKLITVPVFEGRRGHPSIVDGALLPEVRGVRDETLGLRAVMQAHQDEIAEIDVDSDVVLLDLNDPADYVAALEREREATL